MDNNYLDWINDYKKVLYVEIKHQWRGNFNWLIEILLLISKKKVILNLNAIHNLASYVDYILMLMRF